jgi:hypothetical protein
MFARREGNPRGPESRSAKDGRLLRIEPLEQRDLLSGLPWSAHFGMAIVPNSGNSTGFASAHDRASVTPIDLHPLGPEAPDENHGTDVRNTLAIFSMRHNGANVDNGPSVADETQPTAQVPRLAPAGPALDSSGMPLLPLRVLWTNNVGRMASNPAAAAPASDDVTVATPPASFSVVRSFSSFRDWLNNGGAMLFARSQDAPPNPPGPFDPLRPDAARPERDPPPAGPLALAVLLVDVDDEAHASVHHSRVSTAPPDPSSSDVEPTAVQSDTVERSHLMSVTWANGEIATEGSWPALPLWDAGFGLPVNDGGLPVIEGLQRRWHGQGELTTIDEETSASTLASTSVAESLLAHLQVDLRAVDEALARVLGEIDELGDELADWLSEAAVPPWAVAAAVVGCGIGMHHLRRLHHTMSVEEPSDEESLSWVFTQLHGLSLPGDA